MKLTTRISDELNREMDIYLFGLKMDGEKMSKNSFVTKAIELFLEQKKQEKKNEQK